MPLVNVGDHVPPESALPIRENKSDVPFVLHTSKTASAPAFKGSSIVTVIIVLSSIHGNDAAT